MQINFWLAIILTVCGNSICSDFQWLRISATSCERLSGFSTHHLAIVQWNAASCVTQVKTAVKSTVCSAYPPSRSILIAYFMKVCSTTFAINFAFLHFNFHVKWIYFKFSFLQFYTSKCNESEVINFKINWEHYSIKYSHSRMHCEQNR